MSDRVLPLSQPLGYGGLPRMLPGLPTLVAGPVAEPLTLVQAKTHLRVTISDDDDHIQDLISVARDQVERFTRRALYRQKWLFTLDRFTDVIRLPIPPLVSVESISYVDESGNPETVDEGDYIVDTAAGTVSPSFGKVWPPTRWQPGAVNVLFWAGYTDGIVLPNPPDNYTPPEGQPDPRVAQAGDPLKKIPPVAKQAMRLCIGHWYENREEVVAGPTHSQLPMGVKSLLTPLRAW